MIDTSHSGSGSSSGSGSGPPVIYTLYIHTPPCQIHCIYMAYLTGRGMNIPSASIMTDTLRGSSSGCGCGSVGVCPLDSRITCIARVTARHTQTSTRLRQSTGPLCKIRHTYTVCRLQGGVSIYIHPPSCQTRHIYTVCILQGGAPE